MMIIDFLIQTFLAVAFFLGMTGIGFSLLRIFRFQGGNAFFDAGVAYFVSLCLYTAGAVSVLFLLPWKIQALQVFTFLYIVISFLFIFRIVPKKRDDIFRVVRENKFPLAVGLLAVSFFFLQIYHTSILDEWLHRPIVKSFTENGVFPLVNPFSPDQDFIHGYHYGTQIVSSAIQVLTGVGVSESMDVFKLSYFTAAFVLFYGILLKWIGKRREAALGAFLTLFAGSSFFLLDAFSVSHIWRLKWIESEWPLNVPSVYTLSGITWVNIVLSVAFAFLLERIVKTLKNMTAWRFVTLGILFVGFFLISEIFAFLLLGIFSVIVAWKMISESKKKVRSMVILGVLFAVIFYGVHLTGGIVGHFIDDAIFSVRKTVSSEPTGAATSVVESPVTLTTSSLLAFRSPLLWGYPGEKRILSVSGYPLLYVRNFLLEAVLVTLLMYAFYKKKERAFAYPILSSAVAVGFLFPFFFSTSYGTLNLTKMTAFSLMTLHLVGFALLFRMNLKKIILIPTLALFVFAAIPGMLIGTNMQWKWISGKGKEQYCSQNPLCYKGEFIDLLRTFEKEYPGLKRIAVDPKNAKKVVDLTSSYIYGYSDERAEYLIETPEWSKNQSEVDKSMSVSLDVLLESGEYRILKAK